jgi:small subunit ribosomal protein S2
MSKITLPSFTIKQLLEAGVHFGHKTMRRNPKMSRYIYTNNNSISIIDLTKTANLLYRSMMIVRDIAKNNGRILFVSTKKQGAEIVAESAKRCGQYYVNYRWLGGMLTNWKTVSQSIKTLKTLEDQLSGDEAGLNKKEKLLIEREKAKLESVLGGIKNMGGYPDLIFVIDTQKEALAIAEAKKLNIPIMAIVDTNSDPEGITFPIPGNDDSIKSIALYCRLLSDAAISGTKDSILASGLDIKNFESDEDEIDIVKAKDSLKEKNDKEKAEKTSKKFDKNPRSNKNSKGNSFNDKADKKPEDSTSKRPSNNQKPSTNPQNKKSTKIESKLVEKKLVEKNIDESAKVSE